MKILFKNIKGLLQTLDNSIEYLDGHQMKKLSKINNAFLLIEDDQIIDYGIMNDSPSVDVDKVIDVKERFILPAWCDSHTHLVFSESREDEFVDRISGLSYQEIAKRGGGILNSAKKLQEETFEKLYLKSALRLEEVMKLGTGAIEIKSGYGLELSAEIKMLKVIDKLSKNYDALIQPTFLAAHAVPKEYFDKKIYLSQRLLTNGFQKFQK